MKEEKNKRLLKRDNSQGLTKRLKNLVHNQKSKAIINKNPFPNPHIKNEILGAIKREIEEEEIQKKFSKVIKIFKPRFLIIFSLRIKKIN